MSVLTPRERIFSTSLLKLVEISAEKAAYISSLSSLQFSQSGTPKFFFLSWTQIPQSGLILPASYCLQFSTLIPAQYLLAMASSSMMKLIQSDAYFRSPLMILTVASFCMKETVSLQQLEITPTELRQLSQVLNWQRASTKPSPIITPCKLNPRVLKIRRYVRIALDLLSKGGNVMSGIAFSGNVQRVVLESESGVVGEEIREEVDEVIGSIASIINFFSIVVVRESYSDRLIDTHKMPKGVPAPRILNGIEISLLSIDENRADLIEASELTRRAWSSLQPNDKGDGFIFDGESKALPEGIVHGSAALGIVPINILIAGVGLIVQLRTDLIVPKLGGVGEGILSRQREEDGQGDDGQLKQIFHQIIIILFKVLPHIRGMKEWIGVGGLELIIIIKMSQQFNVSFQRQTLSNLLFDQSSHMQQSSVRDESIKNLTFRSNSKEIQEDALKFLNNYQPIYPSFPLSTLQKSPNLSCKVYKQSAYYGEIVNGKKHGLGIMVYNNKKIYQGQWENDKKHGNGSENFPNRCSYRGNYQNGKPEGLGSYTWSNGEVYEGRWRKGERHGSGLWHGVNGDTYNGEWRYGKPEGYGVLTQANGDTYEGDFKESLKHGLGVEKFSNLDMYRGHYANGMPSGQGTYYWADKSYFRGNFLNGLREGKGLWKKGPGNCDKYDGNYKNDKKWGYGEFTWQSGNFYKGNYEGDVRSGYGEMYWLNGSYYKGEWVNGVQHGEGQLYVPQYGYKRAIFSNNEIAEILDQRLVKKKSNKSKNSREIIKEKQEGQDKEVYRFKMSRSFRKKKNNNPIKESVTEQIDFNKEKTTKSIDWGKQSNSIKPQQSKQKQQKRVRLFKQNRKISDKGASNSKRQILQKQPVKNYYQMYSLDISKPNAKNTPEKEKQQITWKSKPKQRILHSSFYLYKLNTWHHKDSISSQRNNTPSYPSNYPEN